MDLKALSDKFHKEVPQYRMVLLQHLVEAREESLRNFELKSISVDIQ